MQWLVATSGGCREMLLRVRLFRNEPPLCVKSGTSAACIFLEGET